MTLYEILSLVVAVASLIMSGSAYYQVTKIKDSNRIKTLNQNSFGDENHQAGRDINA